MRIAALLMSKETKPIIDIKNSISVCNEIEIIMHQNFLNIVLQQVKEYLLVDNYVLTIHLTSDR